VRSNRRERLRQLREQIAKREKPLIIRRRMFGPCQGCGADDQAAGRVYDEPCSTCGFVNVRAVRRQDAVAPAGPTTAPSSMSSVLGRDARALWRL